MTDYHKFDDIRPYRDEEIPAAMQRIAANNSFPLVARFVFPELPVEQAADKIRNIKTIYDFQHDVMIPMNKQVLEGTITEFSLGGIEKLDTSKRYLYVSNHRDIVLDSCILMYALYRDGGHDTGEITFGSNLMQGELVVDIGKSNKMFRVDRGRNPRELYSTSVHLSEYIRYAITEKHQSVWIAQRNGRTKDGIDRTDQGVIKMFGMSGPKDRVDALDELNIVPVSVSYEWESCDILKALELFESRNGEPYIKKPGEDLNSILTGIMQNKGRVHFQICDPIRRDELEALSDVPNVQFHREVAQILDKRICSNYRLFPNAYIAHDLRYGNSKYADRYTKDQYDAFTAHMAELDKYSTDPVLADIFLGIYANPIDNQ
jgi:Acyltransferase.